VIAWDGRWHVTIKWRRDPTQYELTKTLREALERATSFMFLDNVVGIRVEKNIAKTPNGPRVAPKLVLARDPKTNEWY
jgi:glycine/D-amino acid oxidase-like deaminating enzyme